MAGTWASRPRPCSPSAMLNTRSQRSPRGQPLDQSPPVADAVGPVSEAAEGGLDGLDGARLVEFGGFFFAVSVGQVIGPKVVGQADPHGGEKLRVES